MAGSSLKFPYDRKLLPKGAIVEFMANGNYVKVSAVDPVSYTEVSLIGDRNLGQDALAYEAVRKLEYVIKKKLEAKKPTPKNNDKGWLV